MLKYKVKYNGMLSYLNDSQVWQEAGNLYTAIEQGLGYEIDDDFLAEAQESLDYHGKIVVKSQYRDVEIIAKVE